MVIHLARLVLVEKGEELPQLEYRHIEPHRLHGAFELAPIELPVAACIKLSEDAVQLGHREPALLEHDGDLHLQLCHLLALPCRTKRLADHRDRHRRKEQATHDCERKDDALRRPLESIAAVVTEGGHDPEDNPHGLEAVSDLLRLQRAGASLVSPRRVGVRPLQDDESSREEERDDKHREAWHHECSPRVLDRDEQHAPARVVLEQLEDAREPQQLEELEHEQPFVVL